MSGSGECWSCGKPLDGNEICPNCNADQKVKSVSDEDDLDSFLDSALSATSEPTEDTEDDFDFSLPDMEYVEGRSEKSTNISTELDKEESEPVVEVSLPDMDYVEGQTDKSSNLSEQLDEIPSAGTEDFDLPDMDYIEGTTDKSRNISSELDSVTEFKGEVTEEDKDSLLADLDAIMEPTPDTGIEPETEALEEIKTGSPELELEPVSEAIFEEAGEFKPKLRNIGLKKLVWLFGTQYLYWMIVFFLITAGSLKIISQNITVPNPSATAYDILPEGYILSWLAFLAMGFFLSYKIRQYNINPTYRHAFGFLIGFTVIFMLTMQIGLYLFNPSIFNGQYEPYYYLPTLYFYLGWVNYLAYFFSAGVIMFIIGFKPMFDFIFSRTPMYELHPELTTH